MQIDNLCGADVVFPITDYNFGNLVDITLNVSIACHNLTDSEAPVKRFKPSGNLVFVRKVAEGSSDTWLNIGQIIDGEINACLEIGQEYEFGTSFDGKWIALKDTPEKTNYDIEFSNVSAEYNNPDPKYDDYRKSMDDFCDN